MIICLSRTHHDWYSLTSIHATIPQNMAPFLGPVKIDHIIQFHKRKYQLSPKTKPLFSPISEFPGRCSNMRMRLFILPMRCPKWLISGKNITAV